MTAGYDMACVCVRALSGLIEVLREGFSAYQMTLLAGGGGGGRALEASV